MYLCVGTRQLRTLHFLEAALVFCISRGRVSHTDCKAWQASCSERRLWRLRLPDGGSYRRGQLGFNDVPGSLYSRAW